MTGLPTISIATRPLANYELDKAIEETAEMIKNGEDPVQAWRKWFLNDRHRNYARALTDNEIPLIVETLIMEPSGKIIMDKCSGKTAKRRVDRINEYMQSIGYRLYAVHLETDDDGTQTLCLDDTSFSYAGKQEPYTTFETNSFEFCKLQRAANELMSGTDRRIRVQDTWFDYGQQWRYTTLIEDTPDFGGVQMLVPAEQKKILYGTKEEYDNTISALKKKAYESTAMRLRNEQ